MDLNAELNKLLENPAIRRVSRFLANPIIMTIITILVILVIVYLTNESMFAIGFYGFIFLLILFHLHNTILINDLQKENISGEVRDLFTGAVEDRVEMPLNFKHPTDMFGRAIPQPPIQQQTTYDSGNYFGSAQPQNSYPQYNQPNYAMADDSHEYI